MRIRVIDAGGTHMKVRAVCRKKPMKSKTHKRPAPAKVVFLFDVDNTLLDNDRVIADLSKYAILTQVVKTWFIRRFGE